MKNDIFGNAKWIGGRLGAANPMSISKYKFECDFKAEKTMGIVLGARNKDNFILFEIKNGILYISEHCDNAWDGIEPSVTPCGASDGYIAEIHSGVNHIEISVDKRTVSVFINGGCVVSNAEILPENHPFKPYKEVLMLFGFRQLEDCAYYKNIRLTNAETGEVYKASDINGASLGILGEFEDEWLRVENRFELTSAVPCVRLRYSFNADKTVKKAVLYSTARGFYTAYLNGTRVGDEFFSPGFTDYRITIHYQQHDVTALMNKGENVIGADLTDGYYSGCLGYNFKANVYGNRNSFIAVLEIEYTDGTKAYEVTDENWEATDCSPIIYADFLQGEYYDARLEDNAVWDKCKILPPPEKPVPTNGVLENLRCELIPQPCRGAVCFKEFGGVKTKEIPKGHIIYDLGQNIVGTVRIKLSGELGKSIKVRYGEMCRKNGEIYVANLRSAANTDVYVLKGSADGEIFMPEHTAHGFRYVEITGNGFDISESGIEIERVDGIVISNIDRITGDFECSNPLVNRLYKNIVWGQIDNYLLVPTDCPQRNERMGWTGDAQVFARTASYNMDVYEFTRKWLADLRDAQLMYNRNGAVPDTAPLGGDNRPTGGCGGWGDAAVIVPWEMYRAYGDKQILEENYDMMKSWIDYLISEERTSFGMRTVDGEEQPDKSDFASERYIQIQQSRGDHLTFDESTPFILTATAYSAYAAKLTAEAGEVLGKKEDSEKYREIYEKIKKAFNEAWVKEDGTLAYWGEMSKPGINGKYYSNAPQSRNIPSQTAYAVALDFGLIEPTPEVREGFRKSIENNGNKLSVGFLGISHLLPALMKCGFSDLAFKLLEETGNPSWLYSVINGATTIWERWDSYISETDTFGNVAMNSFNHYAYGAIGEWLFGYVLGINPSVPGYSECVLTPNCGGSLEYAKGYHITPHGKIEVQWEKKDGSFKYKGSIPEGMRGVLYMPNGECCNLSGGCFEAECEI